MATLQMGDTTFEKGDTETEKAPYFRGFQTPDKPLRSGTSAGVKC